MPATAIWIDSANAPLDAGAYRILPWTWYWGTSLYVLCEESVAPWRLVMYKSVDLGFTWVAQDALNGPSMYRLAVDRPGAGSLVYVAYTASGAAVQVTFRTFDFATDTWSADFGAAGSPTLDTATDELRNVILLPGNRLRLFYAQQVLGVNHNYWASYDLVAGIWGAVPGGDLTPTGTRLAMEATIAEANGKVHYFHYRGAPEWSHYHRTIDVADVISADDLVYADVDFPAINSSLMMLNSCFHAGTHIKIAFRRWVPPGGESMPFVLSGTPIADAMVWTEESVDPVPSTLGVGGYFVASQGGDMHYWFARGSFLAPPLGTHQIWYYRQPGGAGAWGPREIAFDLGASPAVPPPVWTSGIPYYPSVIVYPDAFTFGTQFGIFFEHVPGAGFPIQPSPICLAWPALPPPPPPAPARPTFSTGKHSGPCGHTKWDDCLAELAGWWRLIEWCRLRDRDIWCLGPDIREEMPDQSLAFNQVGSVLTPPAAAGDVQVLQYRVPFGYDAVLMGWYHTHVGPGFMEGSGDILWRIRAAGRYVKDMGVVNYTMGDWRHIWPVDGEVIFRSGNLVEYFVNVPNISGMIPVGVSRIVCGLRGFLTPAWR